MKPRLFVGSSAEHLDIANAIQENLDRDAEVTIWTQGILELSKFTLEGLVELLSAIDFGLFVMAPADVAQIRKEEFKVARDNVVFELGLFIGRLGRERSFVILPRGFTDFRLPTDLLGMTPATYEPNRTDKNLVAALGPACNGVRRRIQELGRVSVNGNLPAAAPPLADVVSEELDDNDSLSLLESWMGSRAGSENLNTIRFSDVDRFLGLPSGSAARLLETAGHRWGYRTVRRGTNTILFGG